MASLLSHTSSLLTTPCYLDTLLLKKPLFLKPCSPFSPTHLVPPSMPRNLSFTSLTPPPTMQRNIARILGFTISKLPSSYLGAPLAAAAVKHSSWKTLLDKLESKLSLWTFRALNIASRLVLIKSVLQAMPLYLFSILAAPKWVLKTIRNLQRNFLWGS